MFFCCCFFLIKVTISLVTWQWEGVDCLFLASATRTVCITIATVILRPCPVILTNTDMNSNTVIYRTYSVMNDPCKLQHPGALSLLNKLFLGDRSRGRPLPLHRTDVNSRMWIHVLHRDKGSGSGVNGLRQIPLPLTVLPRPMPLTSDHEKQNSTNRNTRAPAQTHEARLEVKTKW